MNRKLVYSIVLVVVLIGVLGVVFNVQKVEAPHLIIFIRADGSIDPSGVNITSSDNVTYTFTADINASIVVQRSNIIIDGIGHTLDGLSGAILEGLNLTGVSNVTIKNVNVVGFGYGIYLQSSTLNIISGNNITFNEGNIYLGNSSDNKITGNTITDGAEAIQLYASSNNTISGNSMSDNYNGVWSRLSSAENVISGNNITNNEIGVYLTPLSNNNIVYGNNITANTNSGIGLWDSSNNSIYGNNIVDNGFGILFYGSTHNHIYGNNIINNEIGVFIWECSDNVFYHSNFINNTQQVGFYPSSYANFWDNGVDGNYWSNYTGVDSNYDGIGDSWYNITQDNTDHYPLMGNFSDFPVTPQEETYHVTTICDSIISEFQFNGTAISFNVTGPDYTVGFCRVTIPNIIVQDLWQGDYRVLVDGEEPIMTNNWTDGTYTYIYFKYLLSEHKVEIVPEFPAWTSTLLILILLTVAIAIYKRKLLKTQIH